MDKPAVVSRPCADVDRTRPLRLDLLVLLALGLLGVLLADVPRDDPDRFLVSPLPLIGLALGFAWAGLGAPRGRVVSTIFRLWLAAALLLIAAAGVWLAGMMGSTHCPLPEVWPEALNLALGSLSLAAWVAVPAFLGAGLALLARFLRPPPCFRITLAPLLLAATLFAAEPTILRVVSYNIRVGGMGMDGKRDLGRTAGVLRALRPDIVVLQEVDRGARRSGGVDVAQVLGDALGLRSHFGAAIPLQGGTYGNAVLTRFPAAGPERVIDLPGGAEHRVALLVPLRIPAGPSEREVLVGCVHLDFRSDQEMAPNGQRLAAVLSEDPRPVIFGGDINFWPGTRTLRALEARLTRLPKTGPAGTYPADNPRGEIDHLFVHPASAWRVRESRVVPEALASDHRPVLAELELLPLPPAK